MARSFRVEMTNLCMVVDLENDAVLALHKVGGWQGVTFHGGHVELGESLLDAVIREVKEETGLTVHDARPCGVIHWHNTENEEKYLVFLYKATCFSGTLLKETDEGRVFWLPISELNEAELAPNMKTYLEVFLTDTIHEAYAEWNCLGNDPLRLIGQ